MIETLTHDERHNMYRPEHVRKALRIIDALTARVAQSEAQNAETQRWADIYRERALAAEAAVESQAGDIKDLRAEVEKAQQSEDRMRAALVAELERDLSAAYADHAAALNAANAQIAELEARELSQSWYTVCAERDAANAQVAKLEDKALDWENSYFAANARCEAAERKLTALQASYTRGSAESEAASLRAELKATKEAADLNHAIGVAADKEAASLRDTNSTLHGQLQQSRDTVASLRAEVERQKKLVELAELSATAHRCKSNESEASLAAATELLRDWDAAWDVHWMPQGLHDRSIDFLANAPAAKETE